MAITLKGKMKRLSAERRKKVEQRAAELVAEELGINQNGVSRLEKRSDLLLSTLRKTVEAMGGRLY